MEGRLKILLRVMIFCVVNFFVCHGLYAQSNDFKIKRLNLEDGLSHATVHHIMQDRHGLIWISTRDGLNRYDGQNFRVFKHEPGNPNSLSANTVWLTYEDSNGLIWIGTNGGGLNVYDPEADRFYRFYHDPERETSISGNTILSIIEDQQGTIWVGTEHAGLNKVIRKGANPEELVLQFKHYLPDAANSESISNGTVMDIKQQNSRYLWIATYGGGINRFDVQNETFKSDFEIGGRYIMSLALNGDLLWAGTKYHGLSLFNIKDESLQNFRPDSAGSRTINSDFVWPVFIDKDGDIWAGTFGGGLNRISVSEKKGEQYYDIKSYKKSSKTPEFPDNYISDVFQDERGVMWIATDNAGISMFSKKRRFREPAVEIVNSDLKISDLKFNDFLRDNEDNLWMGTTSGLLFQPSGSSEVRFLPSDSASKVINVLEQTQDGKILVGTNIGLYLINSAVSTFSKQLLLQSSEGITVDRVFDIIQSPEGTIWLSTNTGLWKLNSKMEIVDRFYHDPQAESSISSSNTGRLLLEEDTLWVATSTAGLNKLNIKNGEVKRFQHQGGNNETIGSNKVLDLFRDHTGQFWVSTYGGGLNKLIYTGGLPKFKKILEEDGLPDNTVKNVMQDEAGNLWVTTQQGLARVGYNSKVITPISVPVEGSNVNLNKFIPAGDNEYILTAANGFLLFNPRDFHQQKKGASLLLAKIKINNKDSLVSSFPAPKELELSYEENFLTFEFSLMDYFSSDFARYQYKMEGINRDWIRTTNQNNVSYSSLSPGDYIFRVKATSYDGTPAQNQLAVKVFISPPFWQTWWFRLTILIAVAGFVYGFYRYRINTLLKIQQTRQSIASNLHDEVSATLSSITYFAQAIRQMQSEKQTKRFVGLISESAFEAKEKITDIIWSIDPDKDDWVNLLSKCRRFASDLLESKNMEYWLNMDTDIAHPLDVEMRQHLWLIFKEMVVNAARHSRAKKVDVFFGLEGGRLKLVVQDNGIGIDDNVQTSGNGIKNIHKRAQQLEADLELETDRDIGTRWIMSIEM